MMWKFNEYEMEPTTKTYFITDTYENQFPIDFVYSKNRKYVVFQYCRATCNGYLDGETEVSSDSRPARQGI